MTVTVNHQDLFFREASKETRKSELNNFKRLSAYANHSAEEFFRIYLLKDDDQPLNMIIQIGVKFCYRKYNQPTRLKICRNFYRLLRKEIVLFMMQDRRKGRHLKINPAIQLL